MVTAKHVIEKAKTYSRELFARVNKVDSRAELIRVDEDWTYHENEASDVAILAASPPRDQFDYRFVDAPGMCATQPVIERERIGVGDDVAIVGLFTQRTGNQSNIPIVRGGIISSMPASPWLMQTLGFNITPTSQRYGPSAV